MLPCMLIYNIISLQRACRFRTVFAMRYSILTFIPTNEWLKSYLYTKIESWCFNDDNDNELYDQRQNTRKNSKLLKFQQMIGIQSYQNKFQSCCFSDEKIKNYFTYLNIKFLITSFRRAIKNNAPLRAQILLTF